MLDPWNELCGGGRKCAFDRFTGLKKLKGKRKRDLVTLLAVGGWGENSANYSTVRPLSIHPVSRLDHPWPGVTAWRREPFALSGFSPWTVTVGCRIPAGSPVDSLQRKEMDRRPRLKALHLPLAIRKRKIQQCRIHCIQAYRHYKHFQRSILYQTLGTPTPSFCTPTIRSTDVS